MTPLRREPAASAIPATPAPIDGPDRPDRRVIRPTTRPGAGAAAVAVAAILAAAVAGTGCRVQRVATAPFRARPDSVYAGDLRGPFTGRVRDASTGDPVAGALVYATWTLVSGYGFEEPAGYRQYVTSTNADGRYAIPRKKDLPLAGSTRLASFHLVIYKRGYVAYRSDRRFSDLGLRTSFTQKMNQVELHKWQSSYSHARHLRYVGGGAALTALTSWEVDDAAAELAGERPQPASLPTRLGPIGRAGDGVVAARVLAQKDIVAVTGFTGKFETGPLGDQPDTPSYSSQHFRALNLPESYDVAIRLWKLAPHEATARYGNLLDTLPQAKETGELADRSLRTAEAEIYGVAFLDKARGVVGLLTCGKSLCGSHGTAVDLAKKVYGHIVALWPLSGETPAGKPTAKPSASQVRPVKLLPTGGARGAKPTPASHANKHAPASHANKHAPASHANKHAPASHAKKPAPASHANKDAPHRRSKHPATSARGRHARRAETPTRSGQ